MFPALPLMSERGKEIIDWCIKQKNDRARKSEEDY